jgi:hypothetical protein
MKISTDHGDSVEIGESLRMYNGVEGSWSEPPEQVTMLWSEMCEYRASGHIWKEVNRESSATSDYCAVYFS